MEKIICAECGHLNQEDSIFCDYCGATLSSEVSSVNHNDKATLTPLEKAKSDHKIRNMVKNIPATKSIAEVSPFFDEEDETPTISNWEVKTELDTDVDDVIESATQIDATVLDSESPTLHLIHCQSQEKLVLPSHKNIIRVGRYNGTFPVDVDLSHFEHSDIVSRLHFIIIVKEKGYFIEDAGSSNGTFVNAKEVQQGKPWRREIKSGDEIILGRNTQLKFSFEIEH